MNVLKMAVSYIIISWLCHVIQSKLKSKLYSFVVYLYVSGSGSITSVGEETVYLSAVVYL